MRQNQNLIKQPFCKCLVALLLSFFYLVAELSFFPYPAFAQNQIPLNVREGSLIGNSLTSSQMTEIALSPELGTIDEFHQGTNGKTIIYIQDAHDSLEAQEHIAKMITYLVEKNEVKTVFEEGYEGLVPTDELFSAFETPQAKEKVSYFLMDKLRLGGAEYAHINRNKDFELVGIDSIKLQKENIEWYKKSADQRESVEKDLTVIRKKIDVLVNRSFPKEIKEWMNLKIRLDNHQIDFLDYLKRITKDSNLDGYPNIALLIKAQLRNDQQSTVDAKNIDTKALFQEVDQFENDYARLHLSEPKDIQTYQIYKSLKLLERLNRVEISSEEFDLAQKALSETSTEKIAEFLFEVTNVPVILSNQWEENIKNAIQFYKTAEARDGVLEKALKEYKELPDREQAILIFGGFHKNRIKSILSEQNYSYFIVTPKITELSEKHQIFYKTLMGIGYHPFEVPSSLRTAARTLSSIVEPQLLNRIHLAVRDFSPDWETWTRETFDLNMTGALMLERSELRANDANEEIWSRFYATGGGNSASMEDLKKIRPFWQRLFHAFEKPVKALDYGTGKFVIAQEMLQHLPEGSEVHAVDLADPRHLVAPQGIQYHQIPGENLSKKFAPQTFDLITGLHALEYGDIDRIIDEIKIIAKPGAKLAFVMHHHESVYVKGSQMMIEESEIVQAANVFNLLKKYLKNPKPENLNRLQAAGQILFEQNELRRSQRRKTDDLEKIMKLIQLANHMMKHKGKENALQYVERHMEQYHAHIQIARMMVEKAGIYGEHNGTELRLLLEAKGFHVEVLKPFVRERKLLGWQVEMRMPGGSPPLAGVMPWDQDQVYKHNRADLTVQIVKADALDQFTIQTYKDGKVSGEKQVIFKKDFDAFFTEFKKISEMGIRSELRYQPISVQVADDLDDMSIAGAGARVFIQTLIKLSNKYPEAEKDFEIIAAALSGVDGEIRQPFAMVDWIYGEPWQRLNRLYAKKVKPNDPSPDRWTKIVDLSHEIEMAIRQLKQGLHNSKENSQTHIDILSKKMAEQPAFGLFTILAVASEKLVKENRTLNYEAILKAIQMRSPSEDWLSENFIPLLNTIKAISQFSDVNRIELIDFMYELLKASSHRSLDSFFQGSLFLTDLMEMEASVEPFERHYEFLIQKIVGKLGEVPKTVTSNVLANTLREMKSKLGKAEVFDQAFYEFVMNGEKSETQKTQKIPTLFYRDAENLLAKRMPTLALILKDKNKMSRLVTALTFLRRMHEKLDPPQDSSLTNLEYADQTRSYVQFGEMRLTFLGGSFRRHVLYVGEGEERFALDLKIPGDQYMGGMERRFVWEENFKVGRDLWQKHGKRSGVAKPLFLYRLIGGPFNLYGVEQSFEAGYNKTFGVVGTLYNDGRRFNTLNFKNPQQSPYLKRVATENQMTMEKLVENAVRATALFTKRVHDAGYRDWDEDSWSDLHDGNMRLQLNGRSEQVADLESMRKEGMEAADRVEQMQFSVGFAPLEIAQSVLPGIVKRAGLDPSDLHWEAMPEATGESLADPQQRHLRSHSQNGHSLVQQNWLQQRSGGLDRSELRSLKELFVSEEVEKIKQRGVWLQMLYPKLNEEAQRVLLHPTFLPVFMGMKPAYFRIEDELRQEPDPVVLYDELNRLAEENDEILKIRQQLALWFSHEDATDPTLALSEILNHKEFLTEMGVLYSGDIEKHKVADDGGEPVFDRDAFLATLFDRKKDEIAYRAFSGILMGYPEDEIRTSIEEYRQNEKSIPESDRITTARVESAFKGLWLKARLLEDGVFAPEVHRYLGRMEQTLYYAYSLISDDKNLTAILINNLAPELTALLSHSTRSSEQSVNDRSEVRKAEEYAKKVHVHFKSVQDARVDSQGGIIFKAPTVEVLARQFEQLLEIIPEPFMERLTDAIRFQLDHERFAHNSQLQKKAELFKDFLSLIDDAKDELISILNMLGVNQESLEVLFPEGRDSLIQENMGRIIDLVLSAEEVNRLVPILHKDFPEMIARVVEEHGLESVFRVLQLFVQLPPNRLSESLDILSELDPKETGILGILFALDPQEFYALLENWLKPGASVNPFLNQSVGQRKVNQLLNFRIQSLKGHPSAKQVAYWQLAYDRSLYEPLSERLKIAVAEQSSSQAKYDKSYTKFDQLYRKLILGEEAAGRDLAEEMKDVRETDIPAKKNKKQFKMLLGSKKEAVLLRILYDARMDRESFSAMMRDVIEMDGQEDKRKVVIEALSSLLQAENPSEIPVQNFVAVTLAIGTMTYSEVAVRKAIELNPGQAFYHYRLGLLLEKEKMTMPALQAYGDALLLDSAFQAAQLGAARMHISLAYKDSIDKRYDEAEAHVGSVLDLLSDLPKKLKTGAPYYHETIQLLLEAIQLGYRVLREKQDAVQELNFANVLARETYLNFALDLLPGNERLLATQRVFYYEAIEVAPQYRIKYKLALIAYIDRHKSESVSISSDDIRQLARLYEEDGEFDDAIKVLEELLTRPKYLSDVLGRSEGDKIESNLQRLKAVRRSELRLMDNTMSFERNIRGIVESLKGDYALSLDIETWTYAWSESQRQEIEALLTAAADNDQIKLFVPDIRRSITDPKIEKQYERLQSLKNVQLVSPDQAFNAAGRKVIALSKEGRTSIWASLLKQEWDQEQFFHPVVVDAMEESPGRVVSAVLLLESGREEILRQKALFDQFVDTNQASIISQLIMTYKFVGQSA